MIERTLIMLVNVLNMAVDEPPVLQAPLAALQPSLDAMVAEWAKLSAEDRKTRVRESLLLARGWATDAIDARKALVEANAKVRDELTKFKAALAAKQRPDMTALRAAQAEVKLANVALAEAMDACAESIEQAKVTAVEADTPVGGKVGM